MGSTIKKNKKKETNIIKDYISWFEIPVLDLKRAVQFYNHIYGFDMETMVVNQYAMAFFPAGKGIGGALVQGAGSIPGEVGPLLYLNAGNDLNNIIQKVNEAGGRVVMPKTFISAETGYFAIFIDTEGNKLAFHSKN
jgi:predicted enzyme related to lactoylglutathione lyase